MPVDRRSAEHRSYRKVRRRSLLPRSGRHRVSWGTRRQASRYTVVQAFIAAVVVLAGLPAAMASFSSLTSNAGNSFVGQTVFPTYPAAVTADTPLLQHRGEDVRSSADTSAALDSSGNSDPGTYQGRTDGPAAWYKFDEASGGAGTSALDSSGSAAVATLAGANVGWAAGTSGTALTTTTGTGYASTPAPIRTDASFTVSAWAMETTVNGNHRTIASQLGQYGSAFFLKSEATTNYWHFQMTQSDVNGLPVSDRAISTIAAQANVWTHVTAVYDDAANLIKLYVNGQLAASAAKTVEWNATGDLTIGRAQYASAPADQLLGRIDDVRAYQRALSDTDVANLYHTPATAWDFTENANVATADVSGHGNTGILTNGAAWTASGHSGAGINFDGSDDVVLGLQPAVRTDKSFSAAAWVNLDTGGTGRSVISQTGTVNSSFGLQYSYAYGGWMAWTSAADTSSPGWASVVSAAPTLDVWTHLAMVYDDDLDSLTLYVDGAPVGTTTATADWNAGGVLTVGRQRWNSASEAWFDGIIDDVRVYDHALASGDVGVLYREPTGRYDLGEGAGTSTADWTGNGNTGTLVNGPTWNTTGPNESTSVSLDGTDDAITTTASAVHTNQSFSIAAWAKTTDLAANYAVASQNGTPGHGFGLRMNVGSPNRWSFYMPTSDVDTGAADQALGGTPTAGVWTHLVAVFDEPADSVNIYVNGVVGTSGTHVDASTWDATGQFQIGRRLSGGAHGRHFKGQIDDVRTYQKALTAADAVALYAETPRLRYEFEEGSGTVVADSSSTGHTGVNSNSAAWHATGHTGGSFYGTTSYVTTPATVLRTDGSFTVSAWAYLGSKAADRAVFSQSGSNVFSFAMEYRSGTDGWQMMMQSSDSTGATGYRADSTGTATLSTWTHLVGVYDDPANEMRLYVDGVLNDTEAVTTDWNATGDFTVARGFWSGSTNYLFNGRIDEVRAYQRVLTADEVQASYTGETQALFPSHNLALSLTAERSGALQGAQQGMQASTSIAYNGTAGASNDDFNATAPTAFTISCWFRARGTLGGSLMAFSNSQTAIAGTLTDRIIFVDSGGRLTYGVHPAAGAVMLRSAATVNDGAWHHVTASLGTDGMKLYVDGVLLTGATTTAKLGGGYWRWGGSQIRNSSTWTNVPTSENFVGSIDEVAVWHSQLTDVQVAIQYHANH